MPIKCKGATGYMKENEKILERNRKSNLEQEARDEILHFFKRPRSIVNRKYIPPISFIPCFLLNM